MIKNPIAVINDFSGGQDTKTPIISMGLNKSPNMRNFHCAGVKERLIQRSGFSKINSSEVSTDNLDTYYPPGYQTYDYALRDATARTQISQGFKAKTSSTVLKVRLWLKKTSTPTGNINIEIQTDSSGKPSGTAVTNGTSANIDVSTLTTSYTWYTFTFATQPTLVSGTQYHLVLQGSNTINGTAYANWGADDYDIVFPDGTMSVYNGTTWAADSKYNAVFEVYITGGSKGNDGFALWDFSSKNMLLGIFGTTLYKMDKSSSGTPDGTWDNLYNVSTEVDYMEYATDAAAQAAYVTNGEVADQQQTADDANSELGGGAGGIEYRRAESFILSGDLTITAVEIKRRAADTGSPSGNWTLRIETNSGGQPSGTLANANASIVVTPPAINTIIKGTFATSFTLSAATTYYLVVQCSNQSDNNYWNIATKSGNPYGSGGEFYSLDGGGTWIAVTGYDLYFKIYAQSLQCYSESTIKNQGTYSLKGIALATSINKTLTRTVSPVIDLSNQNTLKFNIYSSRTGSNIKIGIHDSGGTTTENTPNITVANVWQTVTWDISSVANADKNAIDSIIITIVNADASNTFYIDNFYAASLFTTSRYWTFSDWQSGRALINTDIGLYTYTGINDASVVSAAPISKFIVIFRNYVFAAGIRGSPNTIRYSDLNDYTTWTATNTLSVNTNDGDIITGMRILKGKLYIFKRYSIHRISYVGSNPTFQVDPILGIGCSAHYTIKEIDLGGDYGTVLCFLTTDKKLAIFDGYNVQIINDNLTEESNDLFDTSDDQPLSFLDINLTYSDLFHAIVKSDTSEYILYCVLGTDTTIGYAFIFDYKTGGVYPYDNQIFASSVYAISTNKAKILYCAGYTGYMWQIESGNDDDGTDITAYWVSGKIKPSLVSMLTKALMLGINIKEAYSLATINCNFQFRIDWNVSWTTAETFSYNRADTLSFGKTVLFDIGTLENMLQIKIKNSSSNPAITLYGADLYGQMLGHSVGERAVT